MTGKYDSAQVFVARIDKYVATYGKQPPDTHLTVTCHCPQKCTLTPQTAVAIHDAGFTLAEVDFRCWECTPDKNKAEVDLLARIANADPNRGDSPGVFVLGHRVGE